VKFFLVFPMFRPPYRRADRFIAIYKMTQRTIPPEEAITIITTDRKG